VEEIKDMVAFLKTLNGEPKIYSNPLENPATRPIPKEDRDNLDPFVNSAMESIERAKTLWNKAGATGKSCASCHKDAAKEFNTWATSMPKYEPRLKKVMGVQEFVTRHARATTGENWPMQTPENMDMGIYLHNMANGTAFNVDTKSKEAKAAIERGTKLFERKVGQLNFACYDCHSPDKGANKWIRGQYLGELKGQVDHFPLWRTSRGEIWDIRKRLQWCNVAVRANELPPEAAEYGDIELALTAMSNGMKLSAPGIRH
jgi:sulfur-oxidizing protein SoxA